MVPKAFKEVKQQVDIVGKGRGDHGDSSWKGFAVFSRRTCHYRLCQVIYAHPSVISRAWSASHTVEELTNHLDGGRPTLAVSRRRKRRRSRSCRRSAPVLCSAWPHASGDSGIAVSGPGMVSN